MCSPKGSIECHTKMERAGSRERREKPRSVAPRAASQDATFPVFVRSSFLCFSERNASGTGPSQRGVGCGSQGSQVPQSPAWAAQGLSLGGVACGPWGTGSWCCSASVLHGKPGFDFWASGKLRAETLVWAWRSHRRWGSWAGWGENVLTGVGGGGLPALTLPA